ncbi:MAG TPA: S66 peptidase family protein [Polyangiaceae bacterium]|nr:S66 peptidase family protein [Polyangiaceae bacterium]
MLLRAPRLRPGDTVGIISPSWGGAAQFPHRVARGIEQLHALGFNTKLGAHALNSNGAVSDTAENRAADIHAFLRDPDVRLILATIGGDHCCHLLPHLDFQLVTSHPKLFMGFSDVTVLNVAIWSATQLVTFNGPALLTDFAEYPALLSYTREWFLRAVTEARPLGQLVPSAVWTEETLDWRTKSDLERARVLQESAGWRWLKPGAAEGTLLGGCLESLQHLRGTRFWPVWENAILFFETSEERPSPETVDGILMDYENMGVFENLAGMLVGRPMRYSDQEKASLDEVLLERTQRYAFPIVSGMDFGHTAPQLTLPVGCHARIDTSTESVVVLDAAVA